MSAIRKLLPVGGVASLIRANIKGTEVVITQKGDILRASDGHILFSNPHKIKADTGWAPAVVTGETVVLPWGGFSLIVWDFAKAQGDAWKPAESRIGGIVSNRTPEGKWIDRWIAAAPLIHDGIVYCFNIHGIFYAVDLKQKKLIYRKKLDLEPFDSYCHLGASCSPTLGGRNIYVFDNQGVCLVLKPGPKYEVVARNVIATQPSRDRWGIPLREVLTNGSPVFDGECMYVRGQESVYCIGKK